MSESPQPIGGEAERLCREGEGASGRAPAEPNPWRPPPNLRRAFWAVLGLGLIVRVIFACDVLALDARRDAIEPLDMWLYPAKAQLILEGDYALATAPEKLFKGETGVPGFLNRPEGRARFLRAGDKPLVDAPGYPYLVAASLKLFGSPKPLVVLQILGTLLIAYLTFVLARVAGLSGRVAWLAMTWVTLHPTTLFFAGLVLKPTLITLELLAVCLALGCYLRRPGTWPAVALGCALGAIHLTKGIVPLVVPFLGLGLVLAPAPWKCKTKHAALFVGAFLLVVSPLFVRSLSHGTGPLHNGQSTYLLAVCNFTGADGLHLVQPPVDYVIDMIDGRYSALGVLGGAIETHPSFGHFLALLVRKFQGFCNGYEAWNNVNVYLDGRLTPTLRAFPLASWLLIPCALCGIPAAMRRWRAMGAVWTGLAVVFVSCMVSFVFARYRLPAVPYIAIFAALGIAQFRGSKQRFAIGVLTIGVLLVVCSPWALELTRTGRTPEIRASYSEHEVARTLAERLGASPNRALVVRLQVEAALTHPLNALPDDAPFSREQLVDAMQLHVAAYRACREVDDLGQAQQVLASLARFDPSGELRRRLEAE